MSYSELSVEVRRMLHAPLTPVYEEESFNIKDIEEKEDCSSLIWIASSHVRPC
jgi:hypothetical protein